MEGLCIVLYRLSSPIPYHRMAHTFGRSVAGLSKIVSSMIEWLATNWGRLLEWDPERLSPERLASFVVAVRERSWRQDIVEGDGGGGIEEDNDVFGFLDGTTRSICRPSHYQRTMYSGMTKSHCIRYQVVVTPAGIVVHVSGPEAGNCHDSTIFQDSSLPAWLVAHAWSPDGLRLKVFGNSAYSASDHVARPFVRRDNMPLYMQRFNRRMALVRHTVEQAINHSTNHFQQATWYRHMRIFNGRVGHFFRLGVFFSNCRACLNDRNSGVVP